LSLKFFAGAMAILFKVVKFISAKCVHFCLAFSMKPQNLKHDFKEKNHMQVSQSHPLHHTNTSGSTPQNPTQNQPNKKKIAAF
jgi:hypothetical protein